jgi:hypothetical protein
MSISTKITAGMELGNTYGANNFITILRNKILIG